MGSSKTAVSSSSSSFQTFIIGFSALNKTKFGPPRSSYMTLADADAFIDHCAGKTDLVVLVCSEVESRNLCWTFSSNGNRANRKGRLSWLRTKGLLREPLNLRNLYQWLVFAIIRKINCINCKTFVHRKGWRKPLRRYPIKAKWKFARKESPAYWSSAFKSHSRCIRASIAICSRLWRLR